MPTSKRLACGLALTALLLAAAGCKTSPAGLRLTSYKDPYFPEEYALRLDRCAYFEDASGDLHLTGYSTSALGGAEGEVEQYLHLHLFWKPSPGKTPDHPTSIDATLEYVVCTSGGVLVYRGTAFVYPRFRSRDNVWTAKVESGRLRLDVFHGEPPDILGDTRVRGTMTAVRDPGLALDIQRTIERRASGS